MLEVEKKTRPFNVSETPYKEIIIKRSKKQTMETKEGMLTKIIEQDINVSRMVNETKKVILNNTIQEKLDKVRQALEEK